MTSAQAGTLIRDRRKQRGLSLTDVALALGTDKSLQSRIESGERAPTDEQIQRLAMLLDLPPELLGTASGRLPPDVDQSVPELAAVLTVAARRTTEARATAIPNLPSPEARDLLARSAQRPETEERPAYSEDVRVGKNTTSYRAHSYHTKVPPEAISPLIEHATEPGDIVLDPFCGSGMTGVAALGCGRNALLSDLSPAAVHIAKNYVTPCSPAGLREAARRVEHAVGPTMRWLYDVVKPDGSRLTVEYTTWSDVFACPTCAAEWTFWDVARGESGELLETIACPTCEEVVDKRNLKWVGEIPVETNVSTVGTRRDNHPPTPAEVALIRDAERVSVFNWIPEVPFGPEREMWRASHRAMGITSVTDFYSRRNLHAMAALRHAILQEPDSRVRDALLFAFTAVANRASRRYQWNVKRPTNVMTGTLYISSLRYEWNVWSLFRRKIADVIRYYESFPVGNSLYDRLPSGDPVAEAVLCSATHLHFVPDHSVDLVFMDPPFGSNIFYADSSLLWEAWLGMLTDDAEEMVVNKHRQSNRGGKGLEDYQRLMAGAFGEVRRVLKRGAGAALAFSNTDDNVWQALQAALSEGGLEVISTAVLDKVHKSIKGVQGAQGKQRVTSLDLIISLRARKESAPAARVMDASELRGEVRTLVEAHLSEVEKDGALIGEVYTHVLKALIARRRNLAGVSIAFVEGVCLEIATREDGRWRPKAEQLRPRYAPVGSPYGCLVDDYTADPLPVGEHERGPKQVRGSIAGEVPGARNTVFYNAHSYHTKVPPEAITPFIEHFTRPGDVILDPFCGSGMTGVAALLAGRRALLSDISVAAAHLSFNHTHPCDPGDLAEAFDLMYRSLRPVFEDLYGVRHPDGTRGYGYYTLWSRRYRCPKCGFSIRMWDVIDRATGRAPTTFRCSACAAELKRQGLRPEGNEPVRVSYEVDIDGKTTRVERDVTAEEAEAIGSFRRKDVEAWYPRVRVDPDREMYIRSALHLQQVHEVADFYTPRNLRALALLWRAIQAVGDMRVRQALAFAFTNTAWHGTRMRRFNARGGQRPLTGTLYIPQLSSEANVLEVMRNKSQQLTRYYQELAPSPRTALPAVRVSSATRLADIPSESVDYVFTDPPFGSNIFYADCNLIWESWLGGLTYMSSEAVVNRSLPVARGGKTVTDYFGLMAEALGEIHRVLKPGAWATLVFHNTDPDVWRALQDAAIAAGFTPEQATGLDRKQQSHKGYKGRSGEENVAHFDVVMSMRKRAGRQPARLRPRADESTLREFVAEAAASRDEQVSVQWVHSAVMRRLVSEGYDLGSVSFDQVRMICGELG